MKNVLLVFLLISLAMPVHAGWIGTFAAISAASDASDAKKATDSMSAKLDTLLGLMKQDHDRIDKLEKTVKRLSQKKH